MTATLSYLQVRQRFGTFGAFLPATLPHLPYRGCGHVWRGSRVVCGVQVGRSGGADQHPRTMGASVTPGTVERKSGHKRKPASAQIFRKTTLTLSLAQSGFAPPGAFGLCTLAPGNRRRGTPSINRNIRRVFGYTGTFFLAIYRRSTSTPVSAFEEGKSQSPPAVVCRLTLPEHQCASAKDLVRRRFPHQANFPLDTPPQ